MRITIDLLDEHRAKLHELAALRGEKGYSRVLNEILTWYLDVLDAREAGLPEPPRPILVAKQEARHANHR